MAFRTWLSASDVSPDDEEEGSNSCEPWVNSLLEVGALASLVFEEEDEDSVPLRLLLLLPCFPGRDELANNDGC